MRFKLGWGEQHLVGRLQQQLVRGRAYRPLRTGHFSRVDLDYIAVVQSLCYLSELVLVLLVVQGGAHRLD